MSSTTKSDVSRKNTFSSKMKKLFGSKSVSTSSNTTTTTKTLTPVGTNTKIHNIYNSKNSNRSADDYNNIKSVNSNSPTYSHSSDFSLSKKIDRSSKGSSSRSSLDRDSIGSEISNQNQHIITNNNNNNPLSPMRSLQTSTAASTTHSHGEKYLPNIITTTINPISSTEQNKKESNNNIVLPITPVTTSNSTNVPITPSSNCKRFIILENGMHEHQLKAAKRQEKLTSMLKNIIGSQKTRGDAVSAVPDLMSISSVPPTPLSSVPTGTSTMTNGVRNMDPPTLMSGFIKRLESKGNSGRTGSNSTMPLDNNSLATINNTNCEKGSIRSTSNEISIAQSNNTNPSKSKLCERFADKYGKCIEVAGRGAFGTVRICHKKSTNKQEGETLFAVKEFLKKNNESAERYKKRLTAEYCISSSLHHTNIVGTIDLLKDAKGDFLQVMEYCPGGDLFSLIIAAGKLEYLEADCFFKQLIKGVVYMHDMGVCHRDLKPENLLLTSDGVIKITDFGNSECFKMAWERDIHLSGGVCGSSPYIAPEEYVQEEFDPRAIDIWSCGVIYMAMRTGRQLWSIAMKEDPFYSKYLKGRKEKGGYKPVEQLKRARCRNVIYSMLDPSPSRRITGKQILNSEWGREIKCCHDSHAIKV
ncbi:similar to Saccharomyces cerevisiae YCR008W SAT4 Ser/Thr protein kinase involved in salt tolerance [Maudiozyma saulgeensis]|uniref:non-specific serine/threonine protein kinase n=1 Tax=Maudiozyma saulgeensis TaxID=1789683 RepID=A0A1X7R460_9SACH|nr:similar to Saccharomyces cerevisiae YCR008W SAT4 Ser/Thr protein kinase involved in salt tolerance [Kazachstania saulgeensis]